MPTVTLDRLSGSAIASSLTNFLRTWRSMFLDERRIRHRTTWQAEFSLAYVHAIASAAGVACHVMRVDIDGIDVLLVGDSSEGAVRFPKLDVQIKSWTGAVQDGDYLRYPLKVENYDVLRLPNDRVYTPAILVLVVMPPSQADWFCMTRTEATLRHCAYWKSLAGMPPTTNSSTVTISVPVDDPFSVEALEKLMERIANRDYR